MIDEKSIPVPPTNPGALLREARERRGLTIAAAADALNLRPQIIEALEQERYDALPPRTFARGYLRNYAKLLGLDESSLLASYEQASVPDPLPEPTPVRPPPPGSSSKFLLIGILLLAAIAIAVWYLYPQEAEVDAVVVEEAEPVVAVDDEPAVPVEAIEPEPVEAAPIVTPEPAPVETAPIETDTEASAPVAAPESTVVPPPPPVAAVAPRVVEPAPAVAAEAPAAAGAAPLRIQVEEESWIEVRDSEGRRIYAGLVRGPRELQLEGSAPFDLVLGNAAAVGVAYAGEDVSLDPYIRGEVARLRLPLQQ